MMLQASSAVKIRCQTHPAPPHTTSLARVSVGERCSSLSTASISPGWRRRTPHKFPNGSVARRQPPLWERRRCMRRQRECRERTHLAVVVAQLLGDLARRRDVGGVRHAHAERRQALGRRHVRTHERAHDARVDAARQEQPELHVAHHALNHRHLQLVAQILGGDVRVVLIPETQPNPLNRIVNINIHSNSDIVVCQSTRAAIRGRRRCVQRRVVGSNYKAKGHADSRAGARERTRAPGRRGCKT
jgi:hypothetical protein